MRFGRTAQLFGLAAVLAAAGCSMWASKPDVDEARAAIERQNRRFSRGVEDGNAGALAALYTEDAIALPPGRALARGREAVEEAWKQALDSGVQQLRLTTVDVERSGDVAWETGTARVTVKPKGEKAVRQQAKYVVVWKKVGGEWKLHRDIWNSSE